jgi:uncharacterized protein (TIGR04255 family)
MADAIDIGPLPDYDNPPVVETVLGVQFERLRLKNAHLGAFWKTFDETEWPTVSDAPLLSNQRERFDAGAVWERALHFQLTQDPAGRMQIKNANSDRMIQVQNTRLHLNWLKKTGQSYPRYETVRGEFAAVLEKFRQFVAREKLGDFRPNQWEVTYVNQIPQETVWETPTDWGFFRPLGSVPTIERVIEGESFSGEWHFVIPGKRGRLHAEWQHGKASAEQKEGSERDFVRLTLTARGEISQGDPAAILEGLDLGRSTIVRSFRNLMSDEANHAWKLKS